VIRHGDPDAEAEVTVTGVYELGIQDQAFLGPESGLAIPDAEGGVDVYVATQWLHVDRDQVAPCLGLEPEQVRIHLAGVGGAFGGREDLSMQIHASMLALHTNRPVKMVYNREESFCRPRSPPPREDLVEHRASRDGKLVNVRARILLDGGAYASSSRGCDANASAFACGPYSVENALIESHLRLHEQSALRGDARFRRRPDCFAHEAQMDKLAAVLGDRPGRTAPPQRARARRLAADRPEDHRLFPAAEVIRRAAALPMPEPEELPRDVLRLPGGSGNTTRGEGVTRGVGFAVGFKNVCYSEGFDDSTAARVRLTATDDGLRRGPLRSSGGRPGRRQRDPADRSHRARARRRRPRLGDDERGRLCRLGLGLADDLDGRRRRAARVPCAMEALARRGGELAPGETIDVERVYHHRPTTPLDPETGQVTGEGAHVAYICAAMRVVAEVDVELGLTRIVWIGAAQDVGKALNPQAVYGQIEGGTAQGLGLALMEEIQTRDGLITNASFTDYLIPTTLDMPPVDAELVEEPEPDAPYGVKGVGEPPTVVSTAAVVSALRDATGRALTRVPVRPDELAGL
jgi:CO/xanthine dehydrogenase Mo-binding subunit